MPAPPTSIQPIPLQRLQRSPPASSPLPSHWKQETSNSTLGSVKGKKWGRIRALRPAPKIALSISSSVPCRSASVIPSPIASPSTWWNIGLWVASESRR